MTNAHADVAQPSDRRPSRSITRRRLLRLVRDAAAIAGTAGLLLTIAGFIPFQGERIGWGYARDLYAFWAADPCQPYTTPVGVGFAYLYSPAFLQAFSPLQLLPFEIVSAVWLVSGLVSLWWLRALWMLVIPGVSSDLLLGNVNVFIALALVLSMRWPASWALPLLTKITPGIGVVWLLASRRWRDLVVAIGATVGVTLVSFLLSPSAWADWIDLLLRSAESRGETTAQFAPLSLRLALAGTAVVVAGVWRRPWLLAPAALVATPVIWPASLALLTAIPRLAAHRHPNADGPGPADPKVHVGFRRRAP